MSASDLPPYVPGKPARGLIASVTTGGYAVHVWETDEVNGAPFHADAVGMLGLQVADGVAYFYVSSNGAADFASIIDPLTRPEAEELLRAALPGIEIEPEEGWNFG